MSAGLGSLRFEGWCNRFFYWSKRVLCRVGFGGIFEDSISIVTAVIIPKTIKSLPYHKY